VEFGGKASALINVVTKSGNNAFRGGAVEFFRSDTLDSRNYFDDPEQPVPLLRQHQFGGHLGGPFRRDRTFFFIDYEGQRVDRSLTQTFSVPTAAMRRGDFAGLPALCDPLTRTATGCTPFAGNQIPTSLFSPVAVGLLAHVPQPTAPGAVQNLLAVEPQHTPMDQGTVRIDHRLTDDNTLFGRFTVYHVRDAQPFGTSSLMEPLPLTIGQDVKAQLRNDLDLELKAVVMYNEAITVATEAGDNASRELFERLLKDEEQHVDFLEAQHHQIEQLGYERYLAQQIQGADHT
jgi:antitoxin component of MazEF toxin-antitoxin module